ncbi:MAG: hypothetical protein JNN15_05390 [Blastocatellia bacterium]|nr:hypothetical protein [Blastocatellia bacterium]
MLDNTIKYCRALSHPLALERAYLKNFFSSVFDLPLVIIEAESGYGKTTTLAALANREGHSIRWLTLDEADRDPLSFLQNLLQSICGKTITENSLFSSSKQALELVLIALHDLAISSMIFDNFEVVAKSEAIITLLEQMIDNLPAFTKVVVASRKPANLRRGTRLGNRSATLTKLDLRFDVEDILQYFLKAHNYQLSAKEAAFIAERTEGHPMSINLLGQLTHNLPSYLRVDWERLRIGLDQESLASLLKEVILKLPRWSAQSVRQIREKGIKTMPDNASSQISDLLDTLAERHCLVQQYWLDNSVINIPHESFVHFAAAL